MNIFNKGFTDSSKGLYGLIYLNLASWTVLLIGNTTECNK